MWLGLRAVRRRLAGGSPLKIVSIVGARPQFIKAAALHTAFDARREVITEVLVHTGQHYDYEMSQIFFEGLPLPEPAHHLGVGSGGHGTQTGEMLKRLEPVLASERPDIVVVHGDTNSTLAGALAAAKLALSVAHVEAGLRSGRMDTPEEINRIVADRVSSYLFCPTPTSVSNLAAEGATDGVFLTGDVTREIFETTLKQAPSRPYADLASGRYALATIHRAENTDDADRLAAIFNALALVAKEMPVVVPLHPRTRDALGDASFGDVRRVQPLAYADMLALARDARVVITDSGGLQKEAYWLGVPCVTARRETEWVETLANGWNVLADADTELIAKQALRPPPQNPREDAFGGRDAPAAIAELIVRSFERTLGSFR